jgi:hypothetical protein
MQREAFTRLSAEDARVDDLSGTAELARSGALAPRSLGPQRECGRTCVNLRVL